MFSTLKMQILRYVLRKAALIIRFLLLMVASGLVNQSVAYADDTSSPLDDIKSVYIYNFLSFIDWPEPQDDHYQLCVMAKGSMYQRIYTVVNGEEVEGKPIRIRPLDGKLEGCHLIYWQEGMPISSAELGTLKNSKALLVSDKNNFISDGIGMVAFETRGRKVRVALNLTAIEDAGFKVSSKLLRVVRIER